MPKDLRDQLSSKELGKSGLKPGKNSRVADMGSDTQVDSDDEDDRMRSLKLDGTREGSNGESSSSSLSRTAAASTAAAGDSSAQKRRTSTVMELPPDKDQTLIEGKLLFQQFGSKNWSKKICVLNSRSLFVFSKRVRDRHLPTP